LKNKLETITPYRDPNTEKKEQVAIMFNNISGNYDFLNHFLSLNIDKIWRKKAIKKLKKISPQHILDVATGTGDFALSSYHILNPKKITGIDISSGMLDVGRKKISDRKLENFIEFKEADSENIPFDENTFDAVTVSFGVRNFQNLKKGLSEMLRVSKKGAIIVILELSIPEKFPVRNFYNFYFKRILPIFGKVFSKDNFAYSYLPESVNAFPTKSKFLELLNETGYKNTHVKTLSFGIANIYIGTK